MISWVSALLVLTVSMCMSQSSINVTLTCTSCSSYQMTYGSFNLTMSCPSGTFCSTTNSSSNLCSATNPCDGVVCNHYEVFPSSQSCQCYNICKWVQPTASWNITTKYCPGASKFDATSRKCTLSPYVNCYNASAIG